MNYRIIRYNLMGHELGSRRVVAESETAVDAQVTEAERTSYTIMEDTVILIASGYDWDCPECQHKNRLIASVPRVKCVKCETEFEVSDTEHAVLG